jgi:hypothetical protein
VNRNASRLRTLSDGRRRSSLIQASPEGATSPEREANEALGGAVIDSRAARAGVGFGRGLLLAVLVGAFLVMAVLLAPAARADPDDDVPFEDGRADVAPSLVSDEAEVRSAPLPDALNGPVSEGRPLLRAPVDGPGSPTSSDTLFTAPVAGPPGSAPARVVEQPTASTAEVGGGAAPVAAGTGIPTGADADTAPRGLPPWVPAPDLPTGTSASGGESAGQGGSAQALLPVLAVLTAPAVLAWMRTEQTAPTMWPFLSLSERPG